MTQIVKSALSAENAPLRETLGDAIGVLAICVTTAALLWLPAILSA